MQNAPQSDRLTIGLKSLLAGILTTIGLLLPLGLFGSLFWNSWHQDGPPPSPPSWIQIAREAVATTLLPLFRWWWITLLLVLALSYYFFRRRISLTSPHQGHAPETTN